MRETAIRRLGEYQQVITKAYEARRRGDGDTYTAALYGANQLLERASRELSRREYLLFERAASRSVDVLRKCLGLGLQNFGKRLAEYRLVETLALLLAERSPERLRELEEESRWLLAA